MARTMTPWFLLGLLASGSLAFAACGDDDDDDATGDGDADADTDAGGDADGDADCTPGCAGGPCGPGEWARVCAGTFTMGSPEDEPGRNNNVGSETPHEVTLTGDYEILSTEVTQAGFEALMGYNPSLLQGCGGSCPVENVSWHEAAAYSNALSDEDGYDRCYDCNGAGDAVSCELSVGYATPYACHGYRLPTEAEWEYAARAGDDRATYNGTSDEQHLGCEQPNDVLDSIAWFCGNGGNTTREVGRLGANEWGVYDSLGNVWEWCWDWWGSYPADGESDPCGPETGSGRVARGGSSSLAAGFARAAGRAGGDGPRGRLDFLGFRLARSLP